MRYGACTSADLEFLEGRVAGFRPEDPKLNSAAFRNVSIITARNSQKDTLNRLGAERFARENGQELVEFCSTDRISSRAVDKSKWRGCEQSGYKRISASLRDKLWNAWPSATSEFIAGKLPLCIGMPVMLRANDATELCITKGQEGRVVGWDASIGSVGENILETLFVELVNPPKPVQIPDLPPNVVPLSRTVTHITCLLEDDTLLSVLREQVVVLLNFGMTDYASQGKSRAENAVDLTNCRDHRSVYVALSRGSTAEGTIIVQEFDHKKITSGMSGYLRQEMRELELLDEITKLRYENMLPPEVTGLYRRPLLRSYYAWRSDHKDPTHFHSSIRWDKTQGPRVPEPIKYSEWRVSNPKGKKRKTEDVSARDAPEDPPKKKKKLIGQLDPPIGRAGAGARRPIGTVWDGLNHSCGYDSVFTIVGNVWAEDPLKWKPMFNDISPLLKQLDHHWSVAYNGEQTLEAARDAVRSWMHMRQPLAFPYGPNPTSIDRIGMIMLPSRPHGVGRPFCSDCGYSAPVDVPVLDAYLVAGLNSRINYPDGVRISEWLRFQLNSRPVRCPACSARGIRRQLDMNSTITTVPPLVMISLDDPRFVFDRFIQFDQEGTLVRLALRGVVYGGQGHFTCRFIDEWGTVWFNDGISTGSSCVRQGNLSDEHSQRELARCGAKAAVALIYALA
ncbi:hypothetical protein C8R46DRAFT_895673 [Mycena filopes]|nr:hypothetical protein C8R46DRAFT_895673 [Mycena filopes]